MRDVFVIHGVKNHVQSKFEATVTRLEERLSGYRLIPIFWGDLGAANEYLEHVIPSGAIDDDVRDSSTREPGQPDADIVASLLAPQHIDSSGEETRDDPLDPESRRDLLAERAGQGPDMSVHEWREALNETWAELPYLRSITDPDILRELGDGLARPPEVPPPDQGDEVRGPVDWAKQRLRDMETAAAAVVGAAAGRVNQMLRTQIGPDFAQFAGDIVVYQRRQTDIHDRVREVLAPYGAGTPDHPAHFIAHSLGGVITLDMATDPQDPLHIGGLVTFGSQWPLFQLIDPRSGIDRFQGTPIAMPATIHGRWLNLWEPLDPLAFTAAHTLMLAHNAPNPDDRRAHYRIESGLWTHSSYWTSPELLAAVRDAFET